MDLCRFLAGQEVFQVSADATYDAETDVDITLSGVLGFPGGVSASFLCGFSAEGTRSTEIIGTKGKIVISHLCLSRSYPAEYVVVRSEISENFQVFTSETSSQYLAPFVSEI